MYYADGTFIFKHPSDVCIYNNGIICSEFFKCDGAGYTITHESCRKCGWCPDVQRKRLEKFSAKEIAKAQEKYNDRIAELKRANRTLTDSLYQQAQVNNYLKAQLDKKNHEIVELRVKLGKDK